ncbi:MAG: DUF1292 domain-containing protein [Bacilli bacterium]|nr:DUF1292 domain-containing protein [Bacilli bacterium]
MEKSLINIYDADGNKTLMELILSFTSNGYNYIVYKDLNNNKMYAAKFKKSISEDFDANLSAEELEMVNRIYEELNNDNM